MNLNQTLLKVMKPNLVVFQPYHVQLDSLIERFCDSFCDSHYVYLVRPHSEHRDDSPSGIRFLNHPLDHLPGFGNVDTVIAVGDPEVAARLRESYPNAKLAVWHPAENGEVSDHILALLRPTVLRGTFGDAEEREFARAM